MTDKLQLAGLIISPILFILLFIPPITNKFKKLYFSVHPLTLNTQRRLYFSLLDAFLVTLPSLLFVLDDVLIQKTHLAKSIARNYLPIAAYSFIPIILVWLRPLAAQPLDIWDLLVLLSRMFFFFFFFVFFLFCFVSFSIANITIILNYKYHP